MDPMIAKIVESRRRSIAAIDAEVNEIDTKIAALASVKGAAAGVVALKKVRDVKVARRANLQVELEGLVQLELPGTSSPAEVGPGPVMGKGKPPR